MSKNYSPTTSFKNISTVASTEEKKYLTMEYFRSGGVNTGGQTGSKCVESLDDQKYQLKPSILSLNTNIFAKGGFKNFTRAFKADWTDRENLGEFVASCIVGSPKVSLVYDSNNKKVLIASKYLEGAQGTLDDYAKKHGNVETEKKGGHVHVSAVVEGMGIYNIKDKPEIKKQLAEQIANSARLGDHDCNLGNMMVIKDGAIKRIDYGHAFNDLLNTSEMFGGKVRNKDNPILDYLNRETIGHFKESHRIPKLWRYYSGIVPSAELAEAFKGLGKDKSWTNGLNNARASFKQIMDDLSESKNPDKKTIENIKESLIAINNNISDRKMGKDDLNLPPEKFLDKVFYNIELHQHTKQRQMHQVGELMELQFAVKDLVHNPHKNNISQKDIIEKYENLKGAKGISCAEGIEWVKDHKDRPAFKGTLEELINKELALKEQKELVSDINNLLENGNSGATLQEIKDKYEKLTKIKGVNVKKGIQWEGDKDVNLCEGTLKDFIQKRSNDIGLDKSVTKNILKDLTALEPSWFKKIINKIFGKNGDIAQPISIKAEEKVHLTNDKEPTHKSLPEPKNHHKTTVLNPDVIKSAETIGLKLPQNLPNKPRAHTFSSNVKKSNDEMHRM